MGAWVWIGLTAAAAAFQVARNGLQRSLMGEAGPWGATLVRFLFGLPFSLAFAAVAWALTPGGRPNFASQVYWLTTVLGAATQLAATAALLTAMRRAGFAIGTALQQSSLPLAALIGLFVFGDRLSPLGWTGVAITTAGLLALTLPGHRATGGQMLSGAGFGVLSGFCFGFSLNAFRHAGLALDAAHPVFGAVITVAVVQAMQAVSLGLVLAAAKPTVLAAVARGLRQSLGAGLCGSIASAGWFTALALAPAASVRAVGVVEAPMAAFAGHRLFGERLSVWQWIAGGATAAGVLLTALG